MLIRAFKNLACLPLALLDNASAKMHSFLGQGCASSLEQASLLASIISSIPIGDNNILRDALLKIIQRKE